MIFIKGLPKSKGKEAIFVVGDIITKFAHFMGLSHPFIAYNFWKRAHTLHGVPESIVKDKDRIFLSNYWHALFKLVGIQLVYSSA